MINRNFTHKLILAFSVISISLHSQIKNVAYQLQYNDLTSLYDCYLSIEEGNATTSKQRVQFNAQISLAVPAGSEISVAESYMPLENNVSGTSTKAQKWHISNRVHNDDRKVDFVGIVPRLSPTSFYNDLKQGDKIKLFSVKVSPVPKCGEGVRLFDNKIDPASKRSEMEGGDFSNGFTIGEVRQKYSKNLELINSALPSGDIPPVGEVYESLSIKLQSGVWTKATSYTWTGPNGFFSTQQNPVLAKLSLKNSGTYTLTVKSEEGCVTKKSVNVEVLPIDALTNVENVVTSSLDNNAKFTKVISNLETATKVYPNPATNYINIAVNAYKGADVKSAIYDLDGKVVMNNVFNQKMETSSTEKTIPLKLVGGLYSVVTLIDGVEHTSKFLYVE